MLLWGRQVNYHYSHHPLTTCTHTHRFTHSTCTSLWEWKRPDVGVQGFDKSLLQPVPATFVHFRVRNGIRVAAFTSRNPISFTVCFSTAVGVM
uniref:Uncharacterized protein n=1 Tax=Anopheles atroparvus TaxID=41427 RepID=A0AAG5DMJ2_ANOAO